MPRFFAVLAGCAQVFSISDTQHLRMLFLLLVLTHFCNLWSIYQSLKNPHISVCKIQLVDWTFIPQLYVNKCTSDHLNSQLESQHTISILYYQDKHISNKKTSITCSCAADMLCCDNSKQVSLFIKFTTFPILQIIPTRGCSKKQVQSYRINFAEENLQLQI